MIPAAFDYLRAHTTDEAFAHLQQHGAEARVLAGGQSLIPAMRFRLARPAVLVDINSLTDLGDLRISDHVLAVGAIARDSDIERAPWIGERRWSLIHDVSRVVADPVVRQMGTVVGSLCHNDPAGDWTAVALASRATVVVRGKAGTRRVPIDEFLVDSFATAVGEGEMALGAEFPVPDDRTAGSYQKVERKVGDFATAAAAVQVSLNADGTIRAAGVALSAAGAVRRARGRGRAAAGRPEAIRGADSRRFRRRVAAQRAAGGPARQRRIQEASGRRARRARLASGARASGGAGMKVHVTVNGVSYEKDVEPRTLLAYFLREDCGLTGTHVGCDTSSCGCCVVVMDGTRAVKSCSMFAVQADGHEILTVEGLAEGGKLHALQQGFWDQHGLQCGYCTPGMLLTSYALLKHQPNPSEADIREGLAGNLCRCTGYNNIVKAVQQAAATLGQPVGATVTTRTREQR